MGVSKVRESLTNEGLGPFWPPPRHVDTPERAEVLAWARRQLAWERRLAALQDSNAENEGPLDTGQELYEELP